MKIEDINKKILNYLKDQGPENTFRLSRVLNINRSKILDFIKILQKNQAVEFRSGIVTFLKFPIKDKPVKIQKILFRPKKEPVKLKKIVVLPKRKKISKKKLKLLKELQNENKKLKEKLLDLEIQVEDQSALQNKLRKQKEHMKKLRKTITMLEQKAKVPPKIITKTIIKKVPVQIKKIKKRRKRKAKSKKFKIPTFNFTKFKKSIQQLRVPKVLKTLKS